MSHVTIINKASKTSSLVYFKKSFKNELNDSMEKRFGESDCTHTHPHSVKMRPFIKIDLVY